MKVLVLNAGSSSIKYQLYQMPERHTIARGSVEKIGEGESVIHHAALLSESPKTYEEKRAIASHQEGLEQISSLLLHSEYGVIQQTNEVVLVGHRVVHGGEYFHEAVVITKEVEDQINQLTPLAPLHNPPNLLGITIAQQVFPHAQQVAVFDTAFHQTLPDYVYRYPIPTQLYQEHHIRVYGMHGTSHRYVAHAAARFLQRSVVDLNLITIHLGNGCSMAAVQGGKSIDTSMGLTPLAGLMMGTRSGDIDPAVVYYLTRQTDMSVADIDQLLNKESGLKGIAGMNDLRSVVQQYEAGEVTARLALEMYCYRIKKYIGAYVAVLGQVDAIVFTAGVGENSALVRAMSCRNLSHLGISIDAARNEDSELNPRAIHREDGPVQVLVVPTDEELSIAQQAYDAVQ